MIVNGYCTLDDLKDELTVTDPAHDARFERIITAVSRKIDDYCGFPLRRFWADTTNVTRLFMATDAASLALPDLKEVTTIRIDSAGVGTFDQTWTLGTDAVLGPANAPADGLPYTRLDVRAVAGRTFPIRIDRGVEIVGKWGWPAVPAVVTQACILQSARLHKRKDAALGVAVLPGGDGVGMRLLARLDADVELLLEGLRRPLAAVS